MSGISGLTYGQNAKLNVSGKDNVNLGNGSYVYGRISKIDGEGNATIKLTNGAEMNARIEGDVSNLDSGLLKFKVEGVVDSQIQMSIVTEEVMVPSVETPDDELMKFMEQNGIKKEDAPILKEMLKHNIPLTKENISMVKSMLEFSNKVSGNPDEIKQFIEAYLSSRDIPANSVQGMAVVERLTEFLEAFSKAGKDSLLFFLENNIDFSKENLESFNKLFKGDTNINEVLNEVKNKFVQEANTTISNNNLADNINKTGSFFNNIEQAGINDKTELHNEAFKNIGNGKGLLEGKEESSNLNMNSLSTLEVLKGIESYKQNNAVIIGKTAGGEKASTEGTQVSSTKVEQLKAQIENILKDNGIEPSSVSKEAGKITEALIALEGKDLTADTIKSIIKEITGRDVEIAGKAAKAIANGVTEQKSNATMAEKINLLKESIVKTAIEKSESAKENIKSIINIIKSSENTSEIISMMKSSISDLKVYNKISDEYYYFDMPVNYNDNEYPCKLIIKDDRSDSKNVDSKNFKIVIGVKTIKLGMVDSFLEVNEKNMNLEIKCEEKYMKIFEISKDRFKDILAESGFKASIRITKKIEDAEIDNCREFFGENNIAGIDIKV